MTALRNVDYLIALFFNQMRYAAAFGADYNTAWNGKVGLVNVFFAIHIGGKNEDAVFL